MNWTTITDDSKLKCYMWCDFGDGVYHMRAASEAANEYVLKVTSPGNFTCTCKGFTHRGKCKHADYLKVHVKSERISREWATSYVDLLQSCFAAMPAYSFTVAGSYLRGRVTVKDIDAVVCVQEGVVLQEVVTDIVAHLPDVFVPTIDPKSGRILRGTLDVMPIDLYLCYPGEYGAMCLFLTGPAQYNIFMRSVAKNLGYRLSQYGLYRGETEELVCDCSQQEPIFGALGLQLRSPQEREEFSRRS